MQLIYKKDTTYVLRVERGEELVATVLSFCQQENIDAGWISALGACDNTEISYYDLAKKEYMTKVVEEECELLNLTGNIGYFEGKRMVHAHVTLGKSDYSTVGGHLQSMRITGTCEVYITQFAHTFKREKDSATGLNLLR